ncbi:MAG: gamma carbonic anhydrase family protein, partial [Planctomycetes bacterium]|nr:gamma carbonic anhydrase family protein [Planctomycetota bacterium]
MSLPAGVCQVIHGWKPQVAPDAFVADTARLIGDVRIGPRASVWYGVTIRADLNRIEVGEASNIQDGSAMHVEDDKPCIVGRQVVVGHMAMLHGCTVRDGALIGIGAKVLTGAVVGEGALVGAGALVPEGKEVPPGTLWLGVPGKVVRKLTEQEIAGIRVLAEKYVRVAAGFQ